MIVVWRVTQRCNLSCPFCGFDKRLSWPRRDADIGMIRAFGAVLSEYQHVTDHRVLVSWIGGEPMLWPPLRDLTVYFARELGLRVSTTTNGTTLSSSLVRNHVLEHYSELTVSVDGVGRTHDELRGWPGGYAVLRASVTKLAEGKRTGRHGPLLRANIVLMRQTISEFERLCLELASWGIEEITFNQLGGRDRPEFFPAHRLLPTDAAWLQDGLPTIRARLECLGVHVKGGSDYLRRIHASTRDEALPVMECHPGTRFLFINEEGVVSPCSFTACGYGIPLSELDRPEALMELPGRFAALRRERRLAACEDCHSTQTFEKFAA